MSRDLRESARTEAFSDGVIAFAITLLVLNLRDPLLDSTVSPRPTLFEGLLVQWPAFFAFVTSFATILIMWVNHHNMFSYIRKVDTTMLFLNGLLLFFIVLTAFTTSLIANHVNLNPTNNGTTQVNPNAAAADATTAAAIYSGNAVILGLVWSTVSYYSLKLSGGSRTTKINPVRFLIGPAPYAVSLALAFFNPFLSIVAVLVIAAYWTIASRWFWKTALSRTG